MSKVHKFDDLDENEKNGSLSKEKYKELFKEHSKKLGVLQREGSKINQQVIIILEGWIGALKSRLLGKILTTLDPRKYTLYSASKIKRENMNKPVWSFFWDKSPVKGELTFYNRSWYFLKNEKEIGNDEISEIWADFSYEQINQFEKELIDDGCIVIKIFTDISEKKNKKNLEKIDEIYGEDWEMLRKNVFEGTDYDKYKKIYTKMLKKTDTELAPWHKIDSNNFRQAQIDILKLLEREIEKGIEKNSNKKMKKITADVSFDNNYKYENISNILNKNEPSEKISREEYDKILDELQDDIQRLQYQLYIKQIASVYGFEGWDAGGKGGAIKRFTRALYPLGYEVVPTEAPNQRENNRHYLWRFWNKLPFDGEITIFDRTWYGRVLVERVERFATRCEWQRAYEEINNMEYIWAKHGMIVNKFWMQIDKDEQYKRFMERENNPEKNWKITDEDWRNRDKWDAYEEAINEMLYRTNTEYAPWYVIAGNDKLYARVSVLKHIKENMEKKLKE